MNFALILVVLSLITGIGALIERFVFKNQPSPYWLLTKFLSFCRSYFIVFFVVLLLRSFVIEPFRIPSGSLEPTLAVGDFVAVNKFAYGLRLPVLETRFLTINNPKVADVAVFRWPPDPSFDYIKRVIGTPGDKVSYKNKVLSINGQEAKQDFVSYTVDESSGDPVALYKETLNGVTHDIYVRPNVPAFDFEITVPEGYYFMMGDNRDNSADSRYWGLVPVENLRGKAFLVWMSWNSNTTSFRWSHIGKIIH